MADVFLSYSSQNKDAMQRLHSGLQNEGISVWIDQTGLEKGSPLWQIKIQEAIEAARCIVVILSPGAKNSEWVGTEVSYAKAFEIPVIPVLIEGNKRTAIPISLINTDWIDARKRYSLALAELLGTLRKHLGKEQTTILPTTSDPEIRNLKSEEIIKAMGGQLSSGSGTIGRVRINFGLNAYIKNNNIAYRATISPITTPDVLEVSRKLELRGWKVGGLWEFATTQAFANNKAYVFTWPACNLLEFPLDYEKSRRQVADEIITANELLGLWPEDIDVKISKKGVI
jgi:hypothetical protein